MKKYFTRTLALILALATVFSTVIFANAFSGGQAIWSFDEETGHLTVHSDVPYNDRFQDSDFFRMRNVIKSVSFVDGVTAIEKMLSVIASTLKALNCPERSNSSGLGHLQAAVN